MIFKGIHFFNESLSFLIEAYANLCENYLFRIV